MSYLSKIRRAMVVGKDARTDAVLDACARSPQRPELYAYGDFPIPGFLDKCKDVRVRPIADLDEIVAFAREVNPDLLIVGPEEPLELGLVDAMYELRIPCFGPPRALARIETSKAWARQLLERHRIEGNPVYRVFDSSEGLDSFLTDLGEFVVKPDGLTGGKGVRVSGEHLSSVDEAVQFATDVIRTHGRVVVEERLEGQEFSLQTITDGNDVVHCPLVQDHKRAEEGDTGPNTGGMGSYSCEDGSLPFLRPAELRAAQLINERVVEALRSEEGEIPYRGVLYGGFMVTKNGLRLIEYNARFGDPEALNVLPLLETDFVELCEGVAGGRLASIDVRFAAKATVCKYVVPEGYPEGKGKGDPIHVPSHVLDTPGLRCFWAACERVGQETFMTGSRAVAFTGVAETIEEAERLAELGASSVEGEVRHRRDIGTRAAIDARMSQMDSVRGLTEISATPDR